MDGHDWRPLLEGTADQAARFLEGLPERRVGWTATSEELRAALGGRLPEDPTPAEKVVTALAEAAEPGIVGTQSGRYFGFVIGGALPAALAADWLTGAWDQNAGLYAGGPAAAVVEEVVVGWLAELLGLPAGVSASLLTGCQMAHVTALAAARHRVLADAGWDVEQHGLIGAPPVGIAVGAERHVTVDRALRYLGLGSATATVVPADGQGRMRPDALRAVLEGTTWPTIVCAQVGNVNTGAVDPVAELADITHAHGGWLHVDGAFGLWAAASPSLRHLVEGVEAADSWATDAHKWLNVPYDSGLAFCAHPGDHRAAMSVQASYLIRADPGGERDAMDFTPEFSRRARAFPIYAAIRSLGRSGIAAMIDRCCALARRFAAALAAADGVEVLNEVALNQVLVRFPGAGGDTDERTRTVVRLVQEEGTCWLSGTVWQGSAAMRISVSNWSTTEEDVDRSVDAILRCAATVG